MAWGDDDPVVTAPAAAWGANDPPAQAPGLIDRVTSAITERPLQTATDAARWAIPNLIPGGQFLAPVIERATGPERAPTVEDPSGQTVFNMPIPGALDPGMTFGKAIAAKFGPMFTSEPDEVERIILKNVPGSAAVKDSLGNRMIEYDGKRYYLDMPGVTGMDVARAAGPAMIGVPATAAAVAAGPALGAGALGTAALVGGASGISSLAEDALAHFAGGEGGLKPGKAALATLMGGGAQMLLTRAMPKITQQAALENLGLEDIFAGGSLTDKGLALFKRAGVDPAMFAPEQLQAVVSNVRAGMVDDAAAQAIQQATRQQAATEARIPLTRGQVMGDEAQLIAEDQMRQGAKGTPAQRVLGQFGDNQGEAAQTAVDTTRRGLTSAVEPMAPSDVGQAVGSAWERSAQGLKEARDKAYRTTFAQPGEFDPNAFRNTGPYIRERLSDPARPGGSVVLDDTLTPNAIRALDEAAGVGFGPRANRAMTADAIREMPEPTPIAMQDLDRARKVMLAAKDAAYRNSSTDGRAASAVVKAFDDRVEAALKAGLFDGDPRTLELLQGSRALHALWRERFGKQRDNMGLVNSFISTAAKEGRSGQDLFNALYGAGQLGGRSGSRAMMEHVTRVLGDNPEAMMALREGALQRILGGVDTAGGQKATYGAMAKGIEQAMTGPGREVLDALFTGAERQQIQRLGSTMQTLADTMNKRNPSGTSYPLMNFLRKASGTGMGGLIGAAIGSKMGMPWAGEALTAAGMTAGKLVQDQLASMAAHRATNYVPGISRAPVSQWLRNAAALPAIEGPALDASLPVPRASGGRIGFDIGGAPDPIGASDHFANVLRNLRAADTGPTDPYGPAPSLVPSSPYPIYYMPPGQGGSGVAGSATTGISAAGGPSGVAPPTYDIGSGSVASVSGSPTGAGSVGPTGEGLSVDANAQSNTSNTNAGNQTSSIAAAIGRNVVGLLAPPMISIPMAIMSRVAQAMANPMSPQVAKTGSSGTSGVGNTSGVTANNANQGVDNPSENPSIGVPGPVEGLANPGATGEGGGTGQGAPSDSEGGGNWRGGIIGTARRAGRQKRRADGGGVDMARFGRRLMAGPMSQNVADLRHLGPMADESMLPPTREEVDELMRSLNGEDERARLRRAGPTAMPEADFYSELGAMLRRHGGRAGRRT